MSTATKYPETAYVYELIRMKPGAMARLESVGVTREHFSFRIRDAARDLGVPVERLTRAIEPEPAE